MQRGSRHGPTGGPDNAGRREDRHAAERQADGSGGGCVAVDRRRLGGERRPPADRGGPEPGPRGGGRAARAEGRRQCPRGRRGDGAALGGPARRRRGGRRPARRRRRRGRRQRLRGDGPQPRLHQPEHPGGRQAPGRGGGPERGDLDGRDAAHDVRGDRHRRCPGRAPRPRRRRGRPRDVARADGADVGGGPRPTPRRCGCCWPAAPASARVPTAISCR